MKLRLTSFTLLVALLGAFVMVPRTAAAQPLTIAAPTSGPLTSIPLNGTLSGATLNITQFIVDSTGTTLQAVGNIKTGGGGVLGSFTTPVTLSQGTSATCNILNLTLGPIHLNLLGLVIDTNQIVINITAQSGPGNLLGNLLCGIANLLNGGPLASIANLLNQVLQVLHFSAVNPLNNAPVTGAISGGTLAIKQFVPSSDGLSIVAKGVLKNPAGKVVSNFSTPVSLSQGAKATCNILNLTLGPIHLNLLGLVIDIPNPIVLNITAQTGSLLGNLLCAIANLLNGGPLANIIKLLNDVLYLTH